MRNAEVIRQWQILREIEGRRTGVTIHELAAHVKVTTRTIRRDLQALQEAGFALYDEGDGNETKRWRLDAQPFRSVQEGLSVSDVAAFYLSRTLVDGLSGWPLSDELRAAFAKIEGSLNPRMREFLATLPQVISAKAGPTQRPTGRQARGRDAPAARRDARSTPGRDAVFLGEQQPREVLRRAAVSARARAGRRLSRRLGAAVRRVSNVCGRADRTADASAKRSSAARANCRRTCSAARWACSGPRRSASSSSSPPPWRRTSAAASGTPAQALEELPDGRVRMSLDVSNDWALRSWLLGFGAGVRVIGPTALADALLDEFKRGCRIYEPGLPLTTRTPAAPGPPLPF